MFHPIRGGNRGGRDQFEWNDVKQDKHRENYLGNSVMAPVGRWQNNRDITWYTNKPDAQKDPLVASAAAIRRQDELARIKAAEEDAMMVALGLRKTSLPSTLPSPNDPRPESTPSRIKSDGAGPIRPSSSLVKVDHRSINVKSEPNVSHRHTAVIRSQSPRRHRSDTHHRRHRSPSSSPRRDSYRKSRRHRSRSSSRRVSERTSSHRFRSPPRSQRRDYR